MQNYRDYRRKKCNSKKLLATFYPRKKYVVLLDNLQLKGPKRVKIGENKESGKIYPKRFPEKFHYKNHQTKIGSRNRI